MPLCDCFHSRSWGHVTAQCLWFDCRGALPATLGDLESLESLSVGGSGMTSGNSQNALKQYLPSWLQFDTCALHPLVIKQVAYYTAYYTVKGHVKPPLDILHL